MGSNGGQPPLVPYFENRVFQFNFLIFLKKWVVAVEDRRYKSTATTRFRKPCNG